MSCIWPSDNQAELIAYFGTPGTPSFEKNLVWVQLPYEMYYYDAERRKRTKVTRIRVHRKVAVAFTSIFQDIWEHYGKSQSAINEAGLNEFCGVYNPRMVRGSKTKWSNHAFASAIDLMCSKDPMGDRDFDMPEAVIAIFKRYGFRWGGDFRRADGMHFEAICDKRQRYAFASEDNLPSEHEHGEGDDDESPTEFTAQSRRPWYKRAWNWITGVTGVGGIGYAGLSEPVTTAIVVGLGLVFAFVVVWTFIWFLGPTRVREFMRKQIGV